MRRALGVVAILLVTVNCHTSIAGCIVTIVCHNNPPPPPTPSPKKDPGREVPLVYLWLG